MDHSCTVGKSVEECLRERAKARASKVATGRRTRHRAKIEALLDELASERLADLWQRLYPFPIDPDCELPDRQGIIEDLVDFVQVLQPNLDGMDTDQLCWLLDKCARACKVIGQTHERRQTAPYRSSRKARRRSRCGFVIRAGCELV